jgi:uncharacterized protein
MLHEPLNHAYLGEGRSLARLMDLYERNFKRLRKLVPDFEGVHDAAVSRVEGALDLHLHVLERSRYTTTLCLTYRMEEDDGTLCPDPDLRIRVYHDARLVEALSCRYRPGIGCMPPHCAVKLPILDWKWEINQFLHKWLAYCLGEGHRFPQGGEAVREDGGRILAGS